jgi:ubiquinone/menaquinone biosynthesis C-methylase UbiE
LLIKRDYFWVKVNKNTLLGKTFFEFGKSIGKKLLKKGVISPKLLINPVSIVRYFEFDYVLKNFLANHCNDYKILDVSSPYLFGFYLASQNTGEYKYINPDKNDLTLVHKYSSKLKFGMNYSAVNEDATKLPFTDNSFSHIISISVIEHINANGDGNAMVEMWRVLKPNGVVILTFPVAKLFKEEFSDKNTYGLNVEQLKEKFFFQRFYDEKSITERLLNKISDFTILSTEIFGENKSGFYDSYAKRWQKKGLLETVKDPYYISNYFEKIKSFNEIKDSAVLGITLRKNK